MNTHINWHRLIPALVGLVVAVVTMVTMNAAFGGPGATPSGYELQMRLPATSNLVKKSRVMIRGIRVGEVTRVDAGRDGVDLTVLIDRRYAPLPAGTSFRVGFRTVFAEPFVDITPGRPGGADLPPGATVAASTTTTPDGALSAVEPSTRRRAAKVSKELARGLRDERADERIAAWIDGITAATAEVRQLTGALRGQGEAIADLVNNSAVVVRTTSRREEELRDIVGSTREVTETMAGLTPELDRSLAAFSGLSGDTDGALRAIAPLLTEAVPVVRSLAQDTADLRSASAQSSPATALARALLVDDVPATTRAVTPLLNAAAPLGQAFVRLAPVLPTTVGNLVPTLRYLGDYAPDIGPSFALLADAMSTGDEVGKWVRIFFTVDLDFSGGFDAPCEPVRGGLCSNPYPKPGHALNPQPYQRGSYQRLEPFTP